MSALEILIKPNRDLCIADITRRMEKDVPEDRMPAFTADLARMYEGYFQRYEVQDKLMVGMADFAHQEYGKTTWREFVPGLMTPHSASKDIAKAEGYEMILGYHQDVIDTLSTYLPQDKARATADQIADSASNAFVELTCKSETIHSPAHPLPTRVVETIRFYHDSLQGAVPEQGISTRP